MLNCLMMTVTTLMMAATLMTATMMTMMICCCLTGHTIQLSFFFCYICFSLSLFLFFFC